jgi:hypothetical protein
MKAENVFLSVSNDHQTKSSLKKKERKKERKKLNILPTLNRISMEP